MRDLTREGQTMIVVTHEMGFAREAADEVMFIDEVWWWRQRPPSASSQSGHRARPHSCSDSPEPRPRSRPARRSGHEVEMVEVPARPARRHPVPGWRVKLVNIQGSQVVDTWAFSAHDLGGTCRWAHR